MESKFTLSKIKEAPFLSEYPSEPSLSLFTEPLILNPFPNNVAEYCEPFNSGNVDFDNVKLFKSFRVELFV